MDIRISRRRLITGVAAGTAGLGAFAFADIPMMAVVSAQESKGLKPGEFRWEPQLAPEGAVSVIVSIPDQLVHVYRNGIRIGLSTCSTGKEGHATPTGIFTILEKDRNHKSSTYNDAPMPNMNRLTWSGIALHAGNLPGYPASHGCVRLPMRFSELLFSVTHVGTPVIVADDHSQPGEVTHSSHILSALAEDEMDVAVAKAAERKLPPQEREDGMQHAVSVLVSAADRECYILKDGDILSKGAVAIKQANQPLGSHVFVLVGPHSDDKRQLKWISVGYKPGGSTDGIIDSDAAVLARLQPDAATQKQIVDLMHPGLVLALTDLPAHPGTRTERDFVVMQQDDPL